VTTIAGVNMTTIGSRVPQKSGATRLMLDYAFLALSLAFVHLI
jgi:hypothetical protein